MLQFLDFAGRRHQRCLLKRGTFGTSRWQLYNETTLFTRVREGVRRARRTGELGPLPTKADAASPSVGRPTLTGYPVPLPPGVRSTVDASTMALWESQSIEAPKREG